MDDFLMSLLKPRIDKERDDAKADAFNIMAERLISLGTDGAIIATVTGYDRNHIDSIARRLNCTVSWSEARA